MPTLYGSSRALIHNLFVCQKYTKSRILVMLPNDAFGQGIPQIVDTLHQGVEGYGVNSLRDFVAVSSCPKWQNSKLPIFMFCSNISEHDLPLLITNSVILVIDSTDYFKTIVSCIAKWHLRRAKVWISLSDGVHGLSIPEANHILNYSKTEGSAIRVLGTCSISSVYTYRSQLQQLDPNNTLDTCLHSSKGIVTSKDQNFTWARPGRMLLGSCLTTNPLSTGQDYGLRPAVQLVARVIAVKDQLRDTNICSDRLLSMIKPPDGRIAILDVGIQHGLPVTDFNLSFYHPETKQQVMLLASNGIHSDYCYVNIGRLNVKKGDNVVILGHEKANVDLLHYCTNFNTSNVFTISGRSRIANYFHPYLPY